MKGILLTALLSICINVSFAQNGLEEVIVEKYYVSDANDTLVNLDGGILPVGSVTYRIYADMLPGYKFQAVYGVPDHELRIETTTLFFNNEDRGATSPTYSKNQAANNTVMLDSWVSVGAACNGQIGVLKSDDDGAATVVNSDGVLQNNDANAGIPLTQEDGMVAGSPEPVTIVGINTEIAIFDNQNDGSNGPLFSTYNGSWASLNGSYGADSLTNRVLIAQITTDGVFSFELNIQIGTPSGGVEQYVARNPVASEIQIPSLMYTSITTDIPSVVERSASVIYPNPVSNVLTLVNTEIDLQNCNFRIYNVTGCKVDEERVNGLTSNSGFSIDVSSLTSGVYFLEIGDGITHSIERFVKN